MNTVISNTATPAATSVPAIFAIADARLRLFATKEDYLAFKAAWKALTKSGMKLSSSFYAAHAILMGRDLYKTFSPNRRPQFAANPYAALAAALRSLLSQQDGMFLSKELDAAVTLEQAQVIRKAFASAVAPVRTLMRPSGGFADYAGLNAGHASFALFEETLGSPLARESALSIEKAAS